MFISNYRVFINNEGDGVIAFKQNDIESIILVKKKDLNQKLIFDKHFSTLKSLKFRHYIIAKWIIRDITSLGYIFKYTNNNIFCIEKNSNSLDVKVNLIRQPLLKQLLLEFNLTNY